MATTSLRRKPRIMTLRNSRRNEIMAILFLALGLLLALCLVSAAFYPNDPSWNSSGQTEHLIGPGRLERTSLQRFFNSSGSPHF